MRDSLFDASVGHESPAVPTCLAIIRAIASVLEAPTATAREERIARRAGPFVEPGTQHRHDLGREWGGALLAALSHTAHMGAGGQVHVPAGEPRQLGHPQSGLDGERQQCVISSAEPAGTVGSRQQRVDLAWIKEGDVGPLETDRGDGEDTLDGGGMVGMAERGKTEQAVQRRQAGVAGPRPVVAVVSQVHEKGPDHFGVEVFDVEVRWCLSSLGLDETEQQSEGVPIGGHGRGRSPDADRSAGR